MQDNFSAFTDTPTAPACQGFAITPHDVNELPMLTKAIYVGTGGDVVLQPAVGSDVTFKNVAGGAILDIRVRAVRATGTTAGQIVGLA